MKRFLAVIIALAAMQARAFGQMEGMVTTPEGIRVPMGKAFLEVAAVPGGFRVGVSGKGKPLKFESTFIAPGGVTPKFDVFVDNDDVCVQTKDGELRVDPVARMWSLLDANGNVVIPPTWPGEEKQNLQNGKMWTVMSVPCGEKPFLVYGCGDGADALLQDHGTAALGNGHAVVPYYWSDAGYSVLAVSGDDDVPATWTASPQVGEVRWVFPGEQAALYLMPAGTMREGAEKYAKLTGFAPVPPRWTFGYLQSRWGWKDRAYIDDTLKEFEARKLPVDAFIFDFEWYTKTPDYQVPAEGVRGFSDFEFNDALFPEAKKQIAELHKSGVHVVGIRKPRLGNAGTLANVRVKGWILPAGNSKIDARCLNYSDPAVRAWYAEQMEPLLEDGIDGWWDDEGELTYTLYYWWNMAEAEALAKVRPEERLWTIDRAFSPGVARLGAAAWTGDIHATWEDFHRTPTHLLNWSLAGMPYGACDIGGFSGGTTPLLFTRWMEAGVFFPVMRSHSTLKDEPHFPWLYGAAEEAAMRGALELRYRLIPYYYSLAHETHETGLPMMRPLAMEFPGDKKCANMSDEWMMGDGVLAAPMLDASEGRSLYLPEGTWYALEGGTGIAGKQVIKVGVKLDAVPAYVRAGTILPLGPVVEHTSELPGGPLEVRIFPGKDGAFEMVEDDGETTGYLKGGVRRTDFAWDDATRTLKWTVTGPYAGKDVFTEMKVRVMDGAGEQHALLGASGALRMNK